MNVPEVSPEGAKRRMERRDAYVYLDVRTVPEFIGGHPPGALNIPVAILSTSVADGDAVHLGEGGSGRAQAVGRGVAGDGARRVLDVEVSLLLHGRHQTLR